MSLRGWIGVDLDGTIAFYDTWKGVEHIGDPIPRMMDRVKAWVTEGKIVKIFTARVSGDNPKHIERATRYIQDWCELNGLPRLEVTCRKDYAMTQLWDDRAIQVEENTGRVAAFS